MKKTKIVLGTALATVTMAAIMVSPQALAKKETERHHADRMAQMDANKEKVLEAQLQAMQDEIISLRAAVDAAASAKKVDANTQKVQELDAWMADVKSKPVEKKSKDNMIYFRGGYSMNDQSMAATTNSLNGQSGSLPGSTTGDSNGWNVGAGMDFSLDDNLYGLMKNTELLGELDINYVDMGTFNGSVTEATAGISAPATVSQSMMRLSASPKIKFLKGEKFRPWIIPVGLTLNFISPPSQVNTISYLKPGMNFGTGVDYNVWKSIYVGADVRYFLATTDLDGTNVNGLTAGGQIGLGF
jgi:opacity protein-like surface antigen